VAVERIVVLNSGEVIGGQASSISVRHHHVLAARVLTEKRLQLEGRLFRGVDGPVVAFPGEMRPQVRVTKRLTAQPE
jgi:hypothetical protein